MIWRCIWITLLVIGMGTIAGFAIPITNPWIEKIWDWIDTTRFPVSLTFFILSGIFLIIAIMSCILD
jgi:hypothetical protein